MKRREFVGRLGIGSAALITGAGSVAAGPQDKAEKGHDHHPVEGNLANAVVSFGAWPSSFEDAPVDRMTVPNAPMAPNIHLLLPRTATIKAGGAVNYIVAGFHQIAVYAPGTKPSDINTSTLIPIPGAPPAVGLIDDPNNRLYRGVSPLTMPQDRVEVIHFAKRGLYLVICTVSVHFIDDNMYGWVRVTR